MRDRDAGLEKKKVTDFARNAMFVRTRGMFEAISRAIIFGKDKNDIVLMGEKIRRKKKGLIKNVRLSPLALNGSNTKTCSFYEQNKIADTSFQFFTSILLAL